MKEVESIGGEVSKLSKELEEVKTEIAVSIAYQKKQSKDLQELKEELKKSKEKRQHPLENVFWVVLGGVIMFLITKLIELI